LVVVMALGVLLMGKMEGANGCQCDLPPSPIPAWRVGDDERIPEVRFPESAPAHRWRLLVTMHQAPAAYEERALHVIIQLDTRELYRACPTCDTCRCPADDVLSWEVRTEDGTAFAPYEVGCGAGFIATTDSQRACRAPQPAYLFEPGPADPLVCDPGAGTCTLRLEVTLTANDPAGASYTHAYDFTQNKVVPYELPEGGEAASVLFSAAVIGPDWIECSGCVRPQPPSGLSVELEVEELTLP